MRRFRSLPMRVLLPVLFVLMGGGWFAIMLVTMPYPVPIVVRILSAVFYAGAMTAFFGVWIGRQRRLAGGPDRLQSIGRSFRSGNMPADADPSTWRPLIEHWQQQFRRQRWFAPLVFLPMTALGVWLALTDAPFWWAAVVLFVGMLVWSLVDTPRRLRTADAMLAELDRREADDAEPGRPA